VSVGTMEKDDRKRILSRTPTPASAHQPKKQRTQTSSVCYQFLFIMHGVLSTVCSFSPKGPCVEGPSFEEPRSFAADKATVFL
jgi:hypothetical protein